MFAKLQKATVSFIMSICLHGTVQLQLYKFSENLIFDYFSEICGKNSSFIEIRQE